MERNYYVVRAAYTAASMEAVKYATNEVVERSFRNKSHKDTTIVRMAMKEMEASGFKPLLLNSEGALAPIYERVESDEENASWWTKAIFTMESIALRDELLEGSMLKDLEQAKKENMVEGSICPDCNDGKVREQSSRTRLRCGVCGSIYYSVHMIVQAIGAELTGRYAFENGPGCAFAHAPFTRIQGKHLIVTQHGGLDI
jgi:ribosomal protein S27AE